MYEHQTFEVIMQRMLERVPDNVDKREGSVIWDALSPAASELAQMYMELDIVMNLTFADTSTGEFLRRRTAEHGVNRFIATKAKRKGLFWDSQDNPFDIPIGSRFSIDNLNYVAIEKIENGQFKMECEAPGTIGNQQFDMLIPIDYIDGLVRAELTEVLTPGEDEEQDESLRERYFEAINEPAFGGNISDYKQKINKINGVGGVKVFPIWQGGGTVKCTIIASDFRSPSSELIEEVQTIMDPEVNQGQGLGFAPIGHTVTIEGVTDVMINIETTVTLASDTTIGQLSDEIESTLRDYFLSLRKIWKDTEQSVVRISQIDARILTVQGVIDVSGTNLNSLGENIILNAEEAPVLGTVTINE